MIINAIMSIIVTKYNNYCLYTYNLSNFDGIFLFKILSEITESKIKPLFKSGKFINLIFTFDKNKIKFKDSLLMFPKSLRNLTQAFLVISKSYFPYNFANVAKLYYSGKIPEFKYFEDITGFTKKDYILYCKDFKNKE
jgi:hypothetical protein